MSVDDTIKKSSRKMKLEEKILRKAKKHINEKEPSSIEPKTDNLPTETSKTLDVPTVKEKRVKKKKFKSNDNKVIRNARGVILGDELTTTLLKPSYKDPNEKMKKKRLKKKKRKQKEKEALKVIAKGKSLKEDCIAFLMKWENEKSEWKFEKMKQIWLVKNALNSSVIDDNQFEILLRFMLSIQGKARAAILLDMQSSMNKFDDKFSSDPSLAKEDEKNQYNRARQIVQLLSD